jgi:putative transposase
MTKIAISSVVKAKLDHPKLVIRACLKRNKISPSSFYFKSIIDSQARDEMSLVPIRTLFEERKERIGIRQLQMLLQSRFDLRINRKKIARLKNKFGLVTKIRRKSKYRSAALNYVEHQTCANILNRNFSVKKPDRVYSTDITEIKFANSSRKAYLAAFKDLATNEIVASDLKLHPTMELVTDALLRALDQLTPEQQSQLTIHSDQGSHFTHYTYRTHLRKRAIKQSMSRRGNCLDNAPIESFFGHLKDHLDTESIKTFDELKKHVTDELHYYNHQRPQLRLKKMPPVLYRRHLLALF